jgi:HK97 family phage major capsid protein
MSQNRIESVPALSAVRAIPAALAPWRYKRLPEWQRDFRSADSDVAISEFLRAVATGDRQRADLLQGDPAGTGEPMDGTVGQLVPLPLADYIYPALYRFGKMRQLSRLHTSPSGSLRIPLQTLRSISTWKAEGVAITGTEPITDESISLVLQKLTTLSVTSSEALEDAFGLAEWLTLDVTKQMAQQEDLMFYSESGIGSANGLPLGLEHAASTFANQAPEQYYVPTGTQAFDGGADPFDAPDWTRPTKIDYVHIQNMFYSLPEQARNSAVWTGNDIVERAIDDMIEGDDTAGSSQRPQFPMTEIPVGTISDGVANTPTRNVFGRPFVNMPGQLDLTLTPGAVANKLFFIDMRRAYAILDTGEIRVDRSGLSGSAFASDEVHFRFVHRVDGQPYEQDPSFGPIIDNSGAKTDSAYVYTGSIFGEGNSATEPS